MASCCDGLSRCEMSIGGFMLRWNVGSRSPSNRSRNCACRPVAFAAPCNAADWRLRVTSSGDKSSRNRSLDGQSSTATSSESTRRALTTPCNDSASSSRLSDRRTGLPTLNRFHGNRSGDLRLASVIRYRPPSPVVCVRITRSNSVSPVRSAVSDDCAFRRCTNLSRSASPSISSQRYMREKC